MRHNRKINHLGRTNAHRKAMLSNMAASLILHKRIKTTLAKAKALRVFIEPIITKSKEDTTHSRRMAFGYLQDKSAVSELFREVSPKIMERPGGYTRILKLGNRFGDAAEMCYIELVDFNEGMLAAKTAAETRTTRRSRRASKKKAEDQVVQKAKKEAIAGNEPQQAEPMGMKTEEMGPDAETEAVAEVTEPDAQEKGEGRKDLQDDQAETAVKENEAVQDKGKEVAAQEAQNKDKEAESETKGNTKPQDKNAEPESTGLQEEAIDEPGSEAKGGAQPQDQKAGTSESDKAEAKNASKGTPENKDDRDEEDQSEKKED